MLVNNEVFKKFVSSDRKLCSNFGNAIDYVADKERDATDKTSFSGFESREQLPEILKNFRGYIVRLNTLSKEMGFGTFLTKRLSSTDIKEMQALYYEISDILDDIYWENTKTALDFLY